MVLCPLFCHHQNSSYWASQPLSSGHQHSIRRSSTSHPGLPIIYYSIRHLFLCMFTMCVGSIQDALSMESDETIGMSKIYNKPVSEMHTNERPHTWCNSVVASLTITYHRPIHIASINTSQELSARFRTTIQGFTTQCREK